MYPYIHFLNRDISTYGICMALGVVVCFLSMRLWSKRHHLSSRREASLDLAFILGLIGAIGGAKILYLLTVLPSLIKDLPYLFSQPRAFFMLYFAGGFVFYGGAYGILIIELIYHRISKVPLEDIIRSLLPGVVLAHAFGRIGCFMQGCCYGAPTDSFIGIAFTHSNIAPNGVPLIPIQLIEAACEFVIFALLLVLRRRSTPRTMLVFYTISYGITRFVLEFFRYDAYRGFIGALSLSQWISIVTVGIGIGLLILGHFHPETMARPFEE
mgnify:CR=1 FL=1